MLKTSRAFSRVNVELKTDVSEIPPVSIIRVDQEMWEISETSGFSSTLTRLITLEDFSIFLPFIMFN
jgi:hypothetical protein